MDSERVPGPISALLGTAVPAGALELCLYIRRDNQTATRACRQGGFAAIDHEIYALLLGAEADWEHAR